MRFRKREKKKKNQMKIIRKQGKYEVQAEINHEQHPVAM